MFVEFDQMPDSARVWIYMADRKLDAEDREVVNKVIGAFTAEWAAHGVPLRASYTLAEDRFLVMAVDESHHSPSGCSIDSSVGALRQVRDATGVDFLDRKGVPFSSGDGIQIIRLDQLKQKYRDGVWNGRSLTFNILAKTVGEFRSAWKIPAEATWLKRYVEPRPADTVAR
ncbi:MAG: hypothetical protein LOY03_13310 [Cyclobacteriaceae bacterium]|jgi:hypothetical protein|nr:hypothetical protein [Cyclobacteriaceae bacterium]